MRYYIIAGEASGDLHASNFIKALTQLDPKAIIRGWGGERIHAAGAELVHHYRDTAFMGLWEVIKNIRKISSLLKKCKADILKFKPDVVVLVDYPGFNLRIAQWAKENNFKTCYYISPKLWAWNEKRVFKIKKCIDLMLCIFPFEVDFYKKYNYDVKFVGHPLLDAMDDDKNENTTKTKIAFLPGSRKQEIDSMSTIFSGIAAKFANEKFVVAGISSLGKDQYSKFNLKNIEIIWDDTHRVLKQSKAAIVNSGTATLEAALYNVPQVVCYKTSGLTYEIAKRLVKVKWISPVNLVLNREAVKELIQDQCNAQSVEKELKKLILNEPSRNNLMSDYIELKKMLGGKGASAKAASALMEFLNSIVHSKQLDAKKTVD